MHHSTCLLDVEMLFTFISTSLPDDPARLSQQNDDRRGEDRQYGQSFQELLPADPVHQHTSSDTYWPLHHANEIIASNLQALPYRYPDPLRPVAETLPADQAPILTAPQVVPSQQIKQEHGADEKGNNRIWHRAPNGQFASAAQLQNESSTLAQHKDRKGPNGERVIRKRRKAEEIDRKYRCNYRSCTKAYGTLNRKSNMGMRLCESS